MGYHSIEYYSATKRNEALIHAITWVNPQKLCEGEEARSKISRAGKFMEKEWGLPNIIQDPI
jgi:hypothetical protein